jgi:hypothetical protein
VIDPSLKSKHNSQTVGPDSATQHIERSILVSKAAVEPKANDFYINREVTKRMGVWNPENEDIHPAYKGLNPHADLNETQFFGFSIPEERIHALMYTWYHPNLNLISSGVMVAQGIRPMAPAIDIMDYRAYLSADELTQGFLKYKTSGNYEVEVIEPGQKFCTKYLDKERNSSFDVVHTAIHPPCVWSSDVHLEQPMRTSGEVTIRGKRYEVDGTHTRDRSWGELRSEVPRNIPPITWMTGNFDNGFSFHATAFDSSDLNPVWKGYFVVPPEKALRFGWIIVDGQPAVLQHIRKLTHYDAQLFPAKVELELIDEQQRSFKLVGQTVAGFPFNAWHNCRWPICLTRWTLDGTVCGWGEVQDGQWGDFLLAVS